MHGHMMDGFTCENSDDLTIGISTLFIRRAIDTLLYRDASFADFVLCPSLCVRMKIRICGSEGGGQEQWAAVMSGEWRAASGEWRVASGEW